MQNAEARSLTGLEPDAWLERLDEVAEDRGYFEPLGNSHSALFSDRGTVLLVTFETAENIRARENAQPLGWDLADHRDWSQLCLLAQDETWFRDKRVYGYFDRLVDDGFFEDFDQVIFFGAGMCGYAASAFSVAAPGATVIAVQPQATLNPRIVGWDNRFRSHRRLSFTDRYGFAPHMIDAADRAFVLFDPWVEADAIHASLFTGQTATLVPCRHFGHDILNDLVQMGVLGDLMDAAGDGRLSASDFHKALRARGFYSPYLRNLMNRLIADDRKMLQALAARELVVRHKGKRFTKTLAKTVAALRADGRSLPERRAKAPVPA